MKNYQHIRKMDIEKLAQLLIHSVEVLDFEDYYDDFSTSYYWESPDGIRFYDMEGALEYTIDWLKSDFNGEI